MNDHSFSEFGGTVIYEGRTPNLGINDAILLRIKKRGTKLKKRCTRVNFSVRRCVTYLTQ